MSDTTPSSWTDKGGMVSQPANESVPPPGKYDVLREAEQQAQAATQEPTRPTSLPASARSWTENGDMVSQQASANEWMKQNHAERQGTAAPPPPEKAPDIREILQAAAKRMTEAQSKTKDEHVL